MNNGNFIVLFLLIINSIIPISAGTQNDAGSGIDAPDGILDALDVNLSTTYIGELGDNRTNIDGETDNHDYYKLIAGPTGKLSVKVDITSISMSLTTISILKDGLTVAIETVWDDDLEFNLVVPIGESDTYYIEINSYSDLVDYTFFIEFYNGAITDQNDGGSAGDSELLTPKTITLDNYFEGDIGNGRIDNSGYLDDSDYYDIYIPGEGYLDIYSNMSADENPNFYVTIYTADLHIVYSESNGFLSDEIAFSSPIGIVGTYKLSISSISWNASYIIHPSFQAAILPFQNDAGIGYDASESLIDAPEIGLDTTITGTVGEELLEIKDYARDDEDVYSLGYFGNGKLSINLTYIMSPDSFSSVYVYLYNASDLFRSPYLSLSASSFGVFEQDSVILDDYSLYYIEVWTFSSNVSYRIDVGFDQYINTVTETQSETSTIITETTTTETNIDVITKYTDITELSTDRITSIIYSNIENSNFAPLILVIFTISGVIFWRRRRDT